MQAIEPHEIARLQKILRRSYLLQTFDDRRNFLTLCGLERLYSVVKLDASIDKFLIGLLAKLFESSTPFSLRQKSELSVFLNFISQVDSS